MKSEQADDRKPTADLKQPDQISVLKNQYRSHYRNADAFVVDQAGWLQHHFKDQQQADEFYNWLLSDAHIDSTSLVVGSTIQQDEKDEICWVVALSADCYNEFMGDSDQFSQLLPEDKKADYMAELSLGLEKNKAHVFSEVMAKIPPTEINHLRLLAAFSSGYTLFQMASSSPAENLLVFLNSFLPAAVAQPANVFIALIKKCGSAALDEALITQGIIQTTALHMTALCQPSVSFVELIYKCSALKVDEALRKQTQAGETVMHIIVKCRDAIRLLAILDRCSKEAIGAACSLLDAKGQSVLDWMLRYQSPAVVAVFLTKIDSEHAFTSMLGREGLSERIFQKITNYLLHESSWQDPDLIKKLFKYADDILSENICNAWLQGKKIPVPLLQQVQLHLKTKIVITDIEKAVLALASGVDEKDHKQPMDAKSFPAHSSNTSITTGKGKVVSLADPDLQACVWKEGLSSYRDLHLLAGSETDAAKQATESANILLRSNLLLQGSIVPYAEYKAYIFPQKNRVQFKDIKQTLAAKQAAIKIILPQDWEDNVAQLGDYTYRAVLRKDKQDLEGKQDIFKVLPPGQDEKDIIQYIHRPVPKNKTYIQTKKMAMTFILDDCSTPLFGENNPNRPQVGLFFNLDEKHGCKIKDLYATDIGSHDRPWVGVKSNIKHFMEKTKGIRFSDVNAFKEAVKKKPHYLNEMQVKVTRESIEAIVVASDAPEERRIAREWQRELNEVLNICVPIVFYNRMLRTISEYTPEQIQEDLWSESNTNTTMLMELQARERLLSMKQDAKGEPKDKLLLFKSPTSINLDPAAIREIEQLEKAQATSKTVLLWSELEVKLAAQKTTIPTNESTKQHPSASH